MLEAEPIAKIETTAEAAAPARRSAWRPAAGFVLCRLVVPLWLVTGATFKLVGASPRFLPKEILNDADRLGVDLFALLASLISIEYVAAALMIFVARLARPIAVLILVIFCLVLVREMVAGNTACGCLGVTSPPPWVMLVIDGALLLGVILLPPARLFGTGRWSLLAAGAAGLAAVGLTLHRLLPFIA